MGENQHEPVVEEVLQSVFSEVGQRDSAPRRALVEELSRLATSQEGFTAHELQQRLLESGATVGRATIFRAIRQLVDNGVLDCIDFADGTRLYRVCGGRILDTDTHHHHMACNVCHRIVDFQFCFPKDQLNQIGRRKVSLFKIILSRFMESATYAESLQRKKLVPKLNSENAMPNPLGGRPRDRQAALATAESCQEGFDPLNDPRAVVGDVEAARKSAPAECAQLTQEERQVALEPFHDGRHAFSSLADHLGVQPLFPLASLGDHQNRLVERQGLGDDLVPGRGDDAGAGGKGLLEVGLLVREKLECDSGSLQDREHGGPIAGL